MTKGTGTVWQGNMGATTTPCLCEVLAEMDKHQSVVQRKRRHTAGALEQSGVYMQGRAKGLLTSVKVVVVLFFLEKAKTKVQTSQISSFHVTKRTEASATYPEFLNEPNGYKSFQSASFTAAFVILCCTSYLQGSTLELHHRDISTLWNNGTH